MPVRSFANFKFLSRRRKELRMALGYHLFGLASRHETCTKKSVSN